MADYGAGASGALSGAASGAALGSVVPGIGTAVGAIGGGLMGGLSGLFGSKKKKKKKISTLDKRQKQLNAAQHESIFGEGPLADLYNFDAQGFNDQFDKTVGRQAYRDLNEKGIPAVTGQFRSQGLMNSSYAGDAISKLARDVQESLMGQRAKYQFEGQQAAQGAKRNAVENLQNRQTYAYDPGQAGGFNVGDITRSISPELISALKGVQGIAGTAGVG